MKRFDCRWLLMVPAMLAGLRTQFDTGPLPAPVSQTQYEQYLAALSDDSMEGRNPGRKASGAPVAYLTEQFRALGLKPGNGDSYVQQVPMVEITTSSSAAAPALRGRERLDPRSALRRRRRDVHQACRAGSRHRQGTTGVRGHGVVAPEYNLERLRRRRHARQGRGHPDQRSGLRQSRSEILPWPRDDVLRPLDLQVRRGCAPRRSRRDHRS